MSTTLQELKPSQIKPHPSNPRHDVGDVTELAASIAEQGILEPIVVAPNGTGATYTLLFGHRRLAAAKAAKCKTVLCIVRTDLTEPAAQLEAMLVENLQRTDLTPIEEAEAYQQLLEFPGYTQKRITDKTGRAAATVRARLKLAKLPEGTRTKIHAGQITLADAGVLAEFGDDEPALKRLEIALGTWNWDYAVSSERRRRSQQREFARQIAAVRKAGTTIVSQDQLDEIAEATDPGGAIEGTADGGWVWVDPDGDYEDLRVQPDAHASCPGHAALVEHDEIHYVCTSPDKHRRELAAQADSDNRENPSERAEREAERAEQKRITEQLEVAAQVRRAHLLAVAKDTIRSMDLGGDLLKDALAAICKDDYTARNVVGATLLPDVDGPSVAKIRPQLDGLTMPALAVLIDLAVNARDERALAENAEAWAPGRRTTSYYRPHETTAPWRAKLVDVYGYEFSQPERDLLATPAVDDAAEDGDQPS